MRRLHEVYCMERYFDQIDRIELERIDKAMDAYEAHPSGKPLTKWTRRCMTF